MPVESFERITDPLLYGGKSHNLGAAIRTGLPVPPGFGLSHLALEQVVDADPESCDRVRRRFEALAAGSVAVRSSAIGEDSKEDSFAGHHLSLMHLQSFDSVLDAIRQVWRSGHDPAALAYRQKRGIAGPVLMGVAVQTMVNPECSGVLFSHNPVTNADEILIECSWGLGEAVVTGLVIPDSYRLSKSGEILEKRAGVKDSAVRPKAGGGTEECAVEPDRIAAFCLDDVRLAELHRLAIACEAQFGAGLDLEWACDGDRLFLLQCRAISTK